MFSCVLHGLYHASIREWSLLYSPGGTPLKSLFSKAPGQKGIAFSGRSAWTLTATPFALEHIYQIFINHYRSPCLIFTNHALMLLQSGLFLISSARRVRLWHTKSVAKRMSETEQNDIRKRVHSTQSIHAIHRPMFTNNVSIRESGSHARCLQTMLLTKKADRMFDVYKPCVCQRMEFTLFPRLFATAKWR